MLEEFDEIRTRSIVIVDDKGNERARLRWLGDDKGPGAAELTLSCPDDGPFVSITANGDTADILCCGGFVAARAEARYGDHAISISATAEQSEAAADEPVAAAPAPESSSK